MCRSPQSSVLTEALPRSAPSLVQTVSGAAPLPSWNDGPAKQAANPEFVPPEDRIATFDQDGTTWVEHPIYTQLKFIFDRVSTLAPQHPDWSTRPLFKGLLIGDEEAMAKYTQSDLDAIDKGTQFSMPVDEFRSLATNWMATAKHPRFDRPYLPLVYSRC